MDVVLKHFKLEMTLVNQDWGKSCNGSFYNLFRLSIYYRASHNKMDFLQVLTPKYAHNFQASNGSLENFHIYDNRGGF